MHHALAANPECFRVVMLSVLTSTAQCHGYTGVLVFSLWVERQWGFAVERGRRRGGFLSPHCAHCLADYLAVFVLQQTTLQGCTKCCFFPFSSPLGSSDPCPSTALSGEAAVNLVDAAAQSHSLMGSQSLRGHACEEKEVAAR